MELQKSHTTPFLKSPRCASVRITEAASGESRNSKVVCVGRYTGQSTNFLRVRGWKLRFRCCSIECVFHVVSIYYIGCARH